MNSYANNTYVRPLARAGSEVFIAALRVLVVFVALLISAALSIDLITNSQGLVAYTLLLLGYLYVETKSLWVRETRLFWINPVVLASIFTFVLAFGVTNVLYFMPEDVVALVGLQPIATPWMNQLMLLVVLGACAMWVGYNSGMAAGLPVIVSDEVGAAPDLVRDKGTGIVYRCGDVTALASALGALLQSEALRVNMGTKARELIGERNVAACASGVVVAGVNFTRGEKTGPSDLLLGRWISVPVPPMRLRSMVADNKKRCLHENGDRDPDGAHILRS